MLNVSDLIALVRSQGTADELAARTPARFAPEARRAPVVVWNVCRQCNQSCPHCYASASKKPSPTDLSSEEAHRLVDDLADTGVRILIFSGGEPLLRPDLLDLIEHARERGISPQLSTNGVLLDARMATNLAEAGVGYVGISIDGVPTFNDAYRGMVGAFGRATRGLLNARAAGMRTGLRMTVTRRNRDQVGAMVDHGRAIGVDRFYVSHLVYAGRARNLLGADLAPAESRALLVALFERAETLLEAGEKPSIVTGGNDSDGALLLSWARARHGKDAAARIASVLRRRGGNSAGEGIVCIDDRGLVHPDQFWQSAVLGDVRTQPLAEILAHPFIAELRDRKDKLTGRCATCPYLDLCRGSHRERALARFGDTWASDPSCVLSDTDITTARLEGAA